jgi:hypothetical protein
MGEVYDVEIVLLPPKRKSKDSAIRDRREISFSLPEYLLEILDTAAKGCGITRTDAIKKGLEILAKELLGYTPGESPG